MSSGFATWWADAVVRFRWLVIVVFTALFAYLAPVATSVQQDDDVLAFLPPEAPEVLAFRRAAERYGMLELVLLGLRDGQESLLSQAKVAEVRGLAARLERVDGVAKVLAYPDLPHPQTNALGFSVEPLVPEAVKDDAEIRARVLGSSAARGSMVANDGRAAAMMVMLAGGRSPAESSATIESLLDEARRGWSGELFPGGAPYMQWEAARQSRADLQALSPIVIAVLAVATALLLRSLVAAVLNLLLSFLGVALVLGAMARLGVATTLVSASIPVMLVALGGAFGVHLLSAYQRAAGASVERVRCALAEMWRPVTLSAATTALGFLALLVMPQLPMREHGIIAASGLAVLWVLSVALLPALLSLLPARLLRSRTDERARSNFRMPVWTMAILAVGGLGIASGMTANVDPREMFDDDTELRRSDRFFEEAFGGAQFLQLNIDADLREPVVLRMMRELGQEIAALPGVVDVRSPVDLVAVLNEALGGRRGVPKNEKRAQRVLGQLVSEPAVALLMRPDLKGGVIQVRLRAMAASEAQTLVRQIGRLVQAYNPTGHLTVLSTEFEPVRKARFLDLARALYLRTGREIDLEGRVPLPEATGRRLAAELVRLRDEALDPEEGAVAVAVPAGEREAISPGFLRTVTTAAALEAEMRRRLPSLVAGDVEGLGFAAEHLWTWIDEVKASARVEARCLQLTGKPKCSDLAPVLAELEDEYWGLTHDPGLASARQVPVEISVLGQPLIASAFADSVQRSAWQTTVLSLVALLLVTALAGCAHTVVPAAWALVMSAATMMLLGHELGVASGMVFCIVLGLGVDFAIHIDHRARRHGLAAAADLAPVVLRSALQLAAAFLVLRASALRPLAEFGTALAIGLVFAAFAAIWWMPVLLARRLDESS